MKIKKEIPLASHLSQNFSWAKLGTIGWKIFGLKLWYLHLIQADAITHHKYWFQISSILVRTKNSTTKSNTSFERSDSGLLKVCRLGAWHSYWPATPNLYDKLTFLEEEGVASPWCCHAPVLQDFFVHHQGFQMRYCMSF